jgi:predicted alpha/beta-hydrolase family hydrolase
VIQQRAQPTNSGSSSVPSSVRSIETPAGEARVDVRRATESWLTLVLGHGAGGGIDARDLAALASALPDQGVTVIRVEQPWHVAGRRVATAPPTLDLAWLAVLSALAVTGPLVVGGRSAGARVACRTAQALGAAGALALAFPLHPPGRPEKSRLGELTGAGVPTLVLQGDRDAFGGPGDFPADGPFQMCRVPFADHSLRVPAAAPLTQREALDLVVEASARWLKTLPR